MLGPWLESAKTAASSQTQRTQFERNLRRQITVWGTSPEGGSPIEDYANRQWAGLLSSYYAVRSGRLPCMYLPAACLSMPLALPCRRLGVHL